MSIETTVDCLTPDELRVEQSSATSTSNGNGEFTLSQIEVFEKEFQDSISNSVVGDPLTRAVAQFPDFYTNLASINAVLQSEFSKEQIPKYEILKIKSDASGGNVVLTPVEYALFLADSSMTPITSNFIANQNPPKFLQSLDDYLRGGFATSIMGGFCGTMPNVFGAIGAFFGIIGQIDGLLQDALSFISKIRNIKDPIKALFDAIKVKALIDAIKEKVTKAVMGVVNKIKSAVENFNPAEVIKRAETFIKNTIETKLVNLQEGIMGFFSEENIKKIENKIKGMIDYAVGLFDNPSVEEIMFLISRICGLAAGIETLVQGLKDPLDKTADTFLNGIDMLKANSGVTTAAVVKAGGIRFDDETRKKAIEEADDLFTAAGNAFELDKEYSEIPTWDQIKDGKHPIIKPKVGSSANTRGGWEGLQLKTRAKLIQLHKLANMSAPFILHSGYRSQEFQDVLYQRMLDRNGGKSDGTVAKISQHTSGLAVDISWSSYHIDGAKVKEVVRQARGDLTCLSPTEIKESPIRDIANGIGFNGVGYYNSFIHLDLRSYCATWPDSRR